MLHTATARSAEDEVVKGGKSSEGFGLRFLGQFGCLREVWEVLLKFRNFGHSSKPQSPERPEASQTPLTAA